MNDLDQFFKFKIGDYVTMKFMADAPHYLEPGRARKVSQGVTVTPLGIVERHLQQCEGGIQAKYLVRVFNPTDRLLDSQISFIRDLFAVGEAELTLMIPKPPEIETK